MPNLIDRVRAAGRAAAAASAQEIAGDEAADIRKLRSRPDRPPTYAGIGSRETPPAVLNQMAAIARTLRDDGWTLRTGGADGADTAFEAGTDRRQVEVFLPWPNFNGLTGPYARTLDPRMAPEAERIAAQHHPAWERCRRGARKLHARNAAIILGPTLDDPVDAVVCWTPGGEKKGGTATGIHMAEALGKPVLNLATTTPETVLQELRAVARGRQQASTNGGTR